MLQEKRPKVTPSPKRDSLTMNAGCRRCLSARQICQEEMVKTRKNIGHKRLPPKYLRVVVGYRPTVAMK